MNLNKAIIVGRVTAQPQLRNTPGGTAVTTFTIATNRVWTGKTGNREEATEFHTIVAWGKQAEVASQFLTKGSLTLIEGRIQTRSWQDKQGQARKTTEIICERLQLGPRPQGQGGSAPRAEEPPAAPAQQAPAEEVPTIDLENEIKADEIPF